MRSKSPYFNFFCYFTFFTAINLSFVVNSSQSYAFSKPSSKKLNLPELNKVKFDPSSNSERFEATKSIASSLPVMPQTSNLVKKFEGFRPYAYIDTSGLPVIGYGQTRVNGRSVTMGQYISQAQADIALEQELYQIQKLVLAHVKVDLNPYQLGALTSLVYNAGTVTVKNSTLIRKLNAGDYVGAAQEFVRWNKANRGGKLVVFPGLTKRRIAEQQLFLTPYNRLASNN